MQAAFGGGYVAIGGGGDFVLGETAAAAALKLIGAMAETLYKETMLAGFYCGLVSVLMSPWWNDRNVHTPVSFKIHHGLLEDCVVLVIGF